MTKAEGQNIFTGHKQYLSQILSYNHVSLQEMTYSGIMHFFLNNDLELSQRTGSSSLHILRSYAIFMLSRNFK